MVVSAPIEIRGELGPRLERESHAVPIRVVPDNVPIFDDARGAIPIAPDVRPDEKEGGMDILPVEYPEHLGGVRLIRAVVEGERHDFFVGGAIPVGDAERVRPGRDRIVDAKASHEHDQRGHGPTAHPWHAEPATLRAALPRPIRRPHDVRESPTIAGAS